MYVAISEHPALTSEQKAEIIAIAGYDFDTDESGYAEIIETARWLARMHGKSVHGAKNPRWFDEVPGGHAGE